MTESYWPWWVGGPALAVIALLYPWLNRAPLGVSGALARLLSWRRERSGVAGATTASATTTAVDGCGAGPALSVPAAGDCGVATAGAGRSGNLVFVVAVALGGTLGGWLGERPWGSVGYSPEFHRLFGSGWTGWAVLFVGGVLVGFGTRLSGGCTSGHGLSGCGRLQPASLVATGVFFGLAIAVSFLVEALRT